VGSASSHQYEGIISPFIEETLEAAHAALQSASLTASRVDEILLVGGATRTPFVHRRLPEVFTKRVAKSTPTYASHGRRGRPGGNPGRILKCERKSSASTPTCPAARSGDGDARHERDLGNLPALCWVEALSLGIATLPIYRFADLPIGLHADPSTPSRQRACHRRCRNKREGTNMSERPARTRPTIVLTE
jgi:Hsp70 protein